MNANAKYNYNDNDMMMDPGMANPGMANTEMMGGKKIAKYNKTTKEHKDKCGTIRRVYEKKGMMYIKKKSKKTGKFAYYKVTTKYY
jgi:hypothetical protein